jgi:type IV secretion system protein VirB11
MSAVELHRNIVVAGGVGSGKTTLINSLLAKAVELCRGERVVILEDTREIQCAAPNKVQLQLSEGVDMRQLVKHALRQRPDRIIVGEVRDGAALDMLKAWNTGHPGGFCSIHANSAIAALPRIEQLVAEAAAGDQRTTIADAVNVIIPITRTENGGRKISELIEVYGLDNNNDYTLKIHRGE